VRSQVLFPQHALVLTRARGSARVGRPGGAVLAAVGLIAWITDRAVIDRILEHRAKAGLESPFDARGPPRPR
jgi:hypothetical protein